MALDLSGTSLGPPGPEGFVHQLGLRRLEPGGWLELEHPAAELQRAEKTRLMASMSNDLFVALPGFSAAAEELQSVVADEFELQGVAVPLFDRSLHPVDATARAVREDLCLHALVNGKLTLVAGSVCFPTRWTLAEKVGASLDLIHQPVPGYGPDVGARVNTFVERLPAGPGVWRRNWSLMPTNELCLPGRHNHLPLGTDPTEMWLRTERQTLRRLPVTRAIVFTIAIDVEALAAVANRPADANALATTIESLPPAFATYKGLAERGASVIAYLRNPYGEG